MSSDYGDFCREQRQERQKRRRSRFSGAIRALENLARVNPEFSFYTVGDEYRATLTHKGGAVTAKYWPSTGSTIFLFGDVTTTQHMNVDQLYNALKKAAAKGLTNKRGKRRSPRSTNVRPVLNTPPTSSALEPAAALDGKRAALDAIAGDMSDGAFMAMADELGVDSVDLERDV